MKRGLGLFVLASMMLTATSMDATASSSPEARFVQLINSERTARGLKALTRRSDLDAIAERHSERMRRDGDVYHNRNLGNEIPGSYAMGGENVGVGFDVDGLHAAFMDSPGHRHNILLAGFDEIGLGVVFDGSGEVFVTEVFVDRGSSSTKPKPKPSSSSSPKPQPTREPEKETTRTSSSASKSTSSSSSSTPTTSAPQSEPAPKKPAAPQGPKVDRARAVDLLVRILSSS